VCWVLRWFGRSDLLRSRVMWDYSAALALAELKQGIGFTRRHNGARCCPTTASLRAQRGNPDCVPLATGLLRFARNDGGDQPKPSEFSRVKEAICNFPTDNCDCFLLIRIKNPPTDLSSIRFKDVLRNVMIEPNRLKLELLPQGLTPKWQ
jgi:hypothetical protein